MTISALNIITSSAKLIGVTFKSEALDADEAADGLVSLNDMLDSWSNDGLLISAPTLESFSLTGATSYTIGASGTFNTTRPINILTAIVRISNIDYPLQVITPEQYQTEIPYKSITSSIPQFLVYDNAYPLGTINMFPVPTSGSTLRLLSNKPLTNLSALTTVVNLPPGWKRALRYNLAIEMAPEYGAEVPPIVIAIAKLSLGAIKRATSINKAMPYMPMDGVPYSIYSGTE